MVKIRWMRVAPVAGLLIVNSFLFSACSTVPVTGRQQLSLISSAEMLSMGNQQYDEFLKSSAVVSAGDGRTVMVKNVGRKIQFAVEQYFR